MKDETIAQKPSNLLDEIHSRMKNDGSQNKANVLAVEDPREEKKYSYYLAIKLDVSNPLYVSFKGLKINQSKIKQINSQKITNIQEVIALVKKGNPTVVDKKVPWAKIVDIENVLYGNVKGV